MAKAYKICDGAQVVIAFAETMAAAIVAWSVYMENDECEPDSIEEIEADDVIVSAALSPSTGEPGPKETE